MKPALTLSTRAAPALPGAACPLAASVAPLLAPWLAPHRPRGWTAPAPSPWAAAGAPVDTRACGATDAGDDPGAAARARQLAQLLSALDQLLSEPDDSTGPAGAPSPAGAGSLATGAGTGAASGTAAVAAAPQARRSLSLAPLQARLQGRGVLFVGGRPQANRQLAGWLAQAGGRWLHHVGGVFGHEAALQQLIDQADLAYVPADYLDADSLDDLALRCARRGIALQRLRQVGVAPVLAHWLLLPDQHRDRARPHPTPILNGMPPPVPAPCAHHR